MNYKYFDLVSSLNITLEQVQSIPKEYLSNKYVDNEKRTILFRACLNPFVTIEIIQSLIERGSDIRYRCHNDDFLFNLCRNPGLTVKILSYAVNLGFELNRLNENLISPLHIISRVNGINFYQIFTFMIRNGAKIEDTKLYQSEQENCNEYFIHDKFVPSQLEEFCDHNQVTIPILSLYLSAGAKITNNVFHTIMEKWQVNEELLQFCVDFGEPNLIQDSFCLGVACHNNSEIITDRLVKLLIENGLNINDIYLYSTPLDHLCFNVKATKDQILCLIQYGAKFTTEETKSELCNKLTQEYDIDFINKLSTISTYL